jgi:hypothetical protein
MYHFFFSVHACAPGAAAIRAPSRWLSIERFVCFSFPVIPFLVKTNRK